jgi:hypothetical protein
MCAVCLHNDGITGGECRCRVATSDGKGEGKIARTENYNGADRDEYPANVGARKRLPIGKSSVDTRINPGALADECREHFELPYRARALTGQPIDRQTGLASCPFEQDVTERKNFFANVLQDGGAISSRCAAISGECFVSDGKRLINMMFTAFVKLRRKRLLVERADSLITAAAG